MTRIFFDKERTAMQTAMINLLLEKSEQTIAELSAALGVSIPYTTKSLNELIDMELVQEVGKRDNYARRAPRVYSLIATAGYFLGIDTGHDRLNLAITDFCGDIVYSECNISYEYENTEACFQSLTDKVNAFIEESGIARDNIVEACMSVGGRVKPTEGKTHNYFTCLDTTLADALTQSIGVPSCIDNDTRCMLYGEWLKGC